MKIHPARVGRSEDANVVVTNGDSYRMRGARAKETPPEEALISPRGGDFHLATSGDHKPAVGSLPVWKAHETTTDRPGVDGSSTLDLALWVPEIRPPTVTCRLATHSGSA
jgi:hypothetical protein